MKRLGFLVALGVVFGSVGMGKADPTFLEARLSLRVEAQVLPDPVQWRNDDHHLVGGYVDQRASASASSSTSHGTAISFASASAIYESPARGQVTFDNVGFVQAILQPSGMGDVDNSVWYYTFTTDDENEFKVDYAIGIGDSTAEIVGIRGFSVEVDQNGQAIYAEDMDLNTNGSVAVPLQPNQTYTVRIIPNGAFQNDSGLGISSMWGQFDWTIKHKEPHQHRHQHHVGRHGISPP